MKAHFIRETDEHGYADGWLRVSRLDIKSLKIEVTSESRMDDEYIYLKYYDDRTADAQTFYKAMMERGAYYQQYGWHEDAKDENGLLRNFVELGGDRQTFEVIDGLSAVRDLAPVA